MPIAYCLLPNAFHRKITCVEKNQGKEPFSAWLFPFNIILCVKDGECAQQVCTKSPEENGKDDRNCRICVFRLWQAVQKYREEPKNKHPESYGVELKKTNLPQGKRGRFTYIFLCVKDGDLCASFPFYFAVTGLPVGAIAI